MNWPEDRKEVFLRVGEAFGIPYYKRTKKEKVLTEDGICWAISKLIGPTLILPTIHQRAVYGWFSKFRDNIYMIDGWWWATRCCDDWTPACDNERSLFCCLMAELSDEEFEEIS